MRAAAGALAIITVLTLTACGGNDDNPCPKSIGTMDVVAMVAPLKGGSGSAGGGGRSGGGGGSRPAPAKPAPAPAPKVAPKPYVPPPPPPIYRPSYRTPSHDYRTVYVQSQADHSPLLWMMAMQGAFHSPQQQVVVHCGG